MKRFQRIPIRKRFQNASANDGQWQAQLMRAHRYASITRCQGKSSTNSIRAGLPGVLQEMMQHLNTSRKGQATVEAALLIPVVMLLLLLLTQPMILLYNRMVMENAAAEGCRLMATATAQGSYSQVKYESYIKRRLASIPPVDIFHLHQGACSWKITLEGDENSSEVSVSISNRLKPLPLLGWGASLLGMTDAENNLVQEVRVTMPTQPGWVSGSGGNDPEGWVHAYD